jgi:integrase
LGLKAGVYYDRELKGFGLRVGATASTWFAEYRPGAGGRSVAKKRHKIGRLDKLTADQARAAAQKLLAGVALGSDPAKQKAEARVARPFAVVAADYVEDHVRAKRKERTADYYSYILKLHVNPRIGAKRLNEISREDIADAHSAIAKTASKFVANRALAIVSAVFNWTDPDGRNPARGIERFREDGRERYLTTEEMQRLGEAMIEAETIGLPHTPSISKHAPRERTRTVFGPHAVGAIRLLMLTGCRLREILDLEWSHVDAERGLLFLPDSKTGRKTVVMSTAAQDILKALPRVGRYVIAGRSAGLPDEQPRSDLKKPWAAVLKRAGLDGLRIHDLRHSFASIGAGNGMGLPVVGALLGHKDSKTTSRYAHVAVDASRRAADAIAGQIAAAIGGK